MSQGRRLQHRAAGALALSLVLTLTLAACKGVQKDQWAPGDQSGGSSIFGSGSGSGSGSGGSGSGGSGSGGSGGSGGGSGSNGNSTTVVQQQRVTVSGNDLGITSGSNAGARSGTASTVSVRAATTTCWVVVLDGNTHRGCGDADFTDTRGTAAARATKTSGSGPVQISLTTNGQTVDSGSVSGANRYVTVMQSDGR